MEGIQLLLAAGVTVAIAVTLLMIYNALVALRQRCDQAASDVDVQLRQRHDLIPNVVQTVQAYAGHESRTLEAVSAARARALDAKSRDDKMEAESVLGLALGRLLAITEAYPELKANQNFLELQDTLADVENRIAGARRFLNNATAEYNTTIEQFPAVLIAGLLGFRRRSFHELSGGDRAILDAAPAVQF